MSIQHIAKEANLIRPFIWAFISAGLLLPGLASAQQPQSFPKVTIAGSVVRTIKAESTGRDMDLYIHLPMGFDRNQTKKYPALYILDGQWDFKLMDSVLGGLVYDKAAPEMILVGITYSGENPNYDNLRASDLTPPAERGGGNALNFLKFVKTQLIPFVETNYPADPAQRVLQGNSLGGLFTLYALFNDPGLFSGYVASSPAVTSGAGGILEREAEFAKAHKELPTRLFIGVGSAEGLSRPVQQFIETLRSRGYQGLKLETRVVEGEGHSGNKPETYNRGLRFIFAN